MMKQIDEIDLSILDRISGKPGCSISEAIKPFLNLRSETVLRGRVRALALRKMIRVIPTKYTQDLYRVPAAEEDTNV